ncbi:MULTISPECIES: hypothetical protein [Massilia]|uniref:DUF1579 domain-containing protein n=1 Tax=Massilia haematophila TaxID=457923 RepID=A0ABV7PIQ0_9BURK|nr:hypothetical protein [Massilia sp.]HBZ06540.1 hypothetical protein [Massilia sp.]
MFSPEDFARLQFLVGRWKGHSADGKEFYEEYGRPAPNVFQSHRYASAAFDGRSDGSTISFKDGEVISQWGEFTWKAARIDNDGAVFEPVNAPARFEWRRIDDATLEAHQRWNAEGKEQQHTVRLTRI